MKRMIVVLLAVGLAACGGDSETSDCTCTLTRNGVTKTLSCGEKVCWDKKYATCGEGVTGEGEACVDPEAKSCFYQCGTSGLPSGSTSWIGGCAAGIGDAQACEDKALEACGSYTVSQQQYLPSCLECSDACKPSWYTPPE